MILLLRNIKMSFSIYFLMLIFSLHWNTIEMKTLILKTNNGVVKYQPPEHKKTLTLDFDQKLDHFDKTNIQTWKQKYFVNRKYYKEGGPAFILVGGEAPADFGWMSGGVWKQNAEQFNAIMFQLEHRYFGDSHPTDNASVTYLKKYFNTKQALADIAFFIDGMNVKFNLGVNPKWITFGGSYPGTLSAWARVKYPKKVYGAISSSAPLVAKMDFFEYYQVTEESLKTKSPTCPDEIRNATAKMESLLTNNKTKLRETFKLCEGAINSNDDVANFFEAAGGLFTTAVQYDNDYNPPNIKTYCDIMTNDSIKEPIDRYAKIFIDNYRINTCLNINFASTAYALKGEDWQSHDASRGWYFLLCNELGFFQTTENNSCFGSQVNLEYFTKQCSIAFDIQSDQIKNNVDATNKYYGGLDIKTSRILFLYGSLDPWKSVGMTQTNNQGQESIIIKGGSHTADMNTMNKELDSPEMYQAKERVNQVLSKWINNK